jgi:hypothetical protein
MIQDTERQGRSKTIAVHDASWDYAFRGAQKNVVCHISSQIYFFK